MRTALLILGTVVLIGGAFGAYMHMQPARAIAPEVSRPAMVAPTTRPNGQSERIWPGKAVWILNFDPKTGRLASRFRADEYFPKPSGVIYCTNPVAEFFLSNNERLKVVGENGEIVMKDQPDMRKPFAKAGPSGPPDRGRMNHVMLYLYDNQDDDGVVEGDPHVILRMKTNNIDFDNDSFLITTQEYTDEHGVHIAADQAPVKMWGDYEFEGRGMTLRWNDRDGRLELLEIAHGERLKILHPNTSQKRPIQDQAAAAQPALDDENQPHAVSDTPAEPLESALASRDPSAAGGVAARAARNGSTTRRFAARRPTTEPDHSVYQANFYDNVHVTQGKDTYADAETLRLHFMLKSQPAGTGAQQTGGPAVDSTVGGKSSGNRDAGASATADKPDVIADGSINASATASDDPSTQPTTRHARGTTRPTTTEEPVEIHWTGRLVVAPTATPPPRPVSPGATIVELLGKARQVFVHRAAGAGQDASEIHCASLLYQSSDGSALLNSSATYPQVMLNRIPGPAAAATRPAEASTQPTQVVCDSLDYRGAQHIALLLGKGHATVPIMTDATQSPATMSMTKPATMPAFGPTTRPNIPQVLDAKWDQQAKLYFAPKSGDEMSIERATFDGNVDILHPQLALKSQALDLTFEPAPPTTQPGAPAKAEHDPQSAGAPDESPAGDVARERMSATTRPAKSSGPVLKRALATEDVHCKLTNAAGKSQNIDCDRLELQASRDPQGKTYPHQAYTSGNVHAFDETQELHAGRMDFTLRPATPKLDAATRPAGGEVAQNTSRHDAAAGHAASGSVDSSSVELDHMVARDHVVVTNHEGSTASSDELHVDMDGEDPHVTLTGQSLSHVTDAKHNTLTGPLILVDPHHQLAHVVGPGTLHVVRDTPPGGKAQSPADVIWANHADVDGNANKIDVFGKVVTTSSDADGTINNASGEHVRIDLQNTLPTPVTALTTKPAAVATSQRPPIASGADSNPSAPNGAPNGSPGHRRVASTQPAPLQMDLFKNKQPSAITLDDHAMVRSSLTAPNGDILREFELKAPLIYYAIAATQDLPAHSLLVPSAGQMLTRDNREPGATTKPAKSGDGGPAKGEGAELASSRGATAFQWDKQLLYTEDTHEAVMTGDVVVVHQDADEKQFPVRMTSDKVIAYFKPAKKESIAKPSNPDTRPATDPQQSLELQSVRAIGHLIVTRGTGELAGEHLDYDPATHWLKIYGTDRAPAVFTDSTARGPISANEIWWNTVNWHIKVNDVRARSVR